MMRHDQPSSNAAHHALMKVSRSTQHTGKMPASFEPL